MYNYILYNYINQIINLETIEINNNKLKNKDTKKTKKKKKSILLTDSEDNISDSDNKINIDEINVGYPKPDDPNLQSKIYAKREFYYYKLPNRPDLSNYKEIEEYRKKICIPTGELLEHQSLLSNFLNPDTPYK